MSSEDKCSNNSNRSHSKFEIALHPNHTSERNSGTWHMYKNYDGGTKLGYLIALVVVREEKGWLGRLYAEGGCMSGESARRDVTQLRNVDDEQRNLNLFVHMAF